MDYIIILKNAKKKPWMLGWQRVNAFEELPSEIAKDVKKFADIIGQELSSFFKEKTVLIKK